MTMDELSLNQLGSHTDLNSASRTADGLKVNHPGAEPNLDATLAVGDVAAELAHLRQQNQMLQATCDRLNQTLHTVATDPISWLIQAQVNTPEAPPVFRHPAEPGLVSVIMPAYNAVDFLEQSVKSVWEQELVAPLHLEILVIDDGSKDHTYAMAQKLAQASPMPMRVLTHPHHANRGVAASRNLGIVEAKGEWIAFLDADDAFLPQKTITQWQWLAQHPEYPAIGSYGYNVDEHGQPATGWNSNQIAGDYQTIAPESRLQDPYNFEAFCSGCPIVNSTFMTHRRAIAWAGLFPDALSHQAEDWILFTRIAAQWDIPIVKEPLILYRVHPSSWTTRYFAENLDYGVKLEFLFCMTHWLANRPEFQDQAKRFYRKNLPSYFRVPGRIHALLMYYIALKHGHATGIQAPNSLQPPPDVEAETQRLFEDLELLVGLRRDQGLDMQNLNNELQLLAKLKKYKRAAQKVPGIRVVKKVLEKLRLI